MARRRTSPDPNVSYRVRPASLAVPLGAGAAVGIHLGGARLWIAAVGGIIAAVLAYVAWRVLLTQRETGNDDRLRLSPPLVVAALVACSLLLAALLLAVWADH